MSRVWAVRVLQFCIMYGNFGKPNLGTLKLPHGTRQDFLPWCAMLEIDIFYKIKANHPMITTPFIDLSISGILLTFPWTFYLFSFCHKYALLQTELKAQQKFSFPATISFTLPHPVLWVWNSVHEWFIVGFGLTRICHTYTHTYEK